MPTVEMHATSKLNASLSISFDSLGCWLRSAVERSSASDDLTALSPLSAERAALAICVSELSDGDPLTHPSLATMQRWEPRLRALPPQVSESASASAFGYWMGIAAIAELESDIPLSRMVLNALEEQIDAKSRASATDGSSDEIPLNPSASEMRGIIWARRGRLARLAGHLADAEECYREAARLGRRHRAGEALAQSQLGLAALAAMRGNHPAVLRRCRALLNSTGELATLYRVHAHQLIALSARKKRRFSEALRSAWYAFEFLNKDDFRRSELLLSMAEIAEEMGESKAALHGFDAVVRGESQPRIRIPALVGAIRASLAALNVTGAREEQVARLALYQGEASLMLDRCDAPHDIVVLLISLASVDRSNEDWSRCGQLLERARRIAQESDLFELQFHIDHMRTEIAARRADATAAPAGHQKATSTVAGAKSRSSRRLIEGMMKVCLE